MNITMAGKSKRYSINSRIGGISGPMTVDAANSMIIVITGPNIATNM
jgi:hypothetical protein